jgi:hypothetical protein
MHLDATGKLVFGWERLASDDDTRQLLAESREYVTKILIDLVSDDVAALPVDIQGDSSPHLVLIAASGALDMSISGTPDEPVVTTELWPTTTPPIQAKVTEGPLNPGQSEGPRERTWTFSYPGKQPFEVTHRRAADQYPDDLARAQFARKIAEKAGWPLPS